MKSNISEYYIQHDCQRIYQGDIVRDWKNYFVNKSNEFIESKFRYSVVISQDCDLEQYKTSNNFEEKNNQFLFNILLLPSFPANQVRDGTHLKEIFNIQQDRKNSKEWSLITRNNNSRYHYLPNSRKKEWQVPELIIDFKLYFTANVEYSMIHYKKYYLATVNELFRESLSLRFCNYISRIGLPEIHLTNDS
jgi:hypothetical protein